MAKKKISELPLAGPLLGGERLPVVQDATTKAVTVDVFVDSVAGLVGPEILNSHVVNPNAHPQYAKIADVPSLAPVQSVNGETGAVIIDKTDVGLGNVDNTSDLNKPISTATQAALNGKADTLHTHAIGDVTGLQTALDGKAATVHSHVIGDVTGLQTALDGKEPAFSKGNLVQGTGVTLTGTLTNRLVGTGNVTIEASGGGGITWTTTASPITLAASDAKIVTAAVDITLPASTATGDQFIVHAKVSGVRVVSNGNVITGVGSGNNLTLIAGETVWLIASATNTLEIV